MPLEIISIPPASMTLLEQIRYYSAVASHYRRLNYQLEAHYRILYASPLHDGRRGLADDVQDAYAARWQNMNDSLTSFLEVKRGEYSQLETRSMQAVDADATTINHDAFVLY